MCKVIYRNTYRKNVHGAVGRPVSDVGWDPRVYDGYDATCTRHQCSSTWR